MLDSQSGATVYVLEGDDGETDAWLWISVHSTRERAEARRDTEAARKTNAGSSFEAPAWDRLCIDEVIVDG